MKKVYVVLTIASLMLATTVAFAQHVPVTDPATECPALCDALNPDPAVCMLPATTDCFTTPGAPCDLAWPTAPFAGMPTWPLKIYGEIDDPDGIPNSGDESFNMTAVAEEDPFVVDLPVPGTYDFCAWTDQLVCSLFPFVTFLPEIGEFSYVVQCISMDINGPINECKKIPVTSNGIPDRYEFAVLTAILNNPAHALHAAAVAAMQTNLDALAGITIEATRAVMVNGNPLDARALSYNAAPWLIPSLAGILSAAAALDDPLTNAALDQLLGLLADLGITLPPGGIGALCDGVPAAGPEGDASGNGFTNREIYEWFIQVNPAMTVAEYVTLALDPATVVPAKVSVTGAGNANVGEAVTLTASISNVASGYSASSYVWYKWSDTGLLDADNCPIWDWVVIPGETGSSLTIAAAALTDSGDYAVDVAMDDGTKAVLGDIRAKATLTVTDAAGVPVGGALGLTLLAGACALAGAVGIRRRK